MIIYLFQGFLTWSTSATTFNYVQNQGLLVLKTNKIHINMYINKLGGGIAIPAQLQDYHCSSLKTLRSNQCDLLNYDMR